MAKPLEDQRLLWRKSTSDFYHRRDCVSRAESWGRVWGIMNARGSTWSRHTTMRRQQRPLFDHGWDLVSSEHGIVFSSPVVNTVGSESKAPMFTQCTVTLWPLCSKVCATALTLLIFTGSVPRVNLFYESISLVHCTQPYVFISTVQQSERCRELNLVFNRHKAVSTKQPRAPHLAWFRCAVLTVCESAVSDLIYLLLKRKMCHYYSWQWLNKWKQIFLNNNYNHHCTQVYTHIYIHTHYQVTGHALFTYTYLYTYTHTHTDE